LTRDGKPWGLPWWSGRNGLFYNTDHLQAAGLSGPPKSYAEVWQYAEKLTQKNAAGELTRAGISLRLTGPSGGTQKFGYFYYQLAGVQMFEPGKKPGTVQVTIAKNIDAAARVLLDHVEHLHGPKKSDDWALKHDAQGFACAARDFHARELGDPVRQEERAGRSSASCPCRSDKAWGAYNNLKILSVNKDCN
jgi:multiple sugar transport system substrate-binding protein